MRRNRGQVCQPTPGVGITIVIVAGAFLIADDIGLLAWFQAHPVAWLEAHPMVSAILTLALLFSVVVLVGVATVLYRQEAL